MFSHPLGTDCGPKPMLLPAPQPGLTEISRRWQDFLKPSLGDEVQKILPLDASAVCVFV